MMLDKWTPYTTSRWAFTVLLVLAFTARILIVQVCRGLRMNLDFSNYFQRQFDKIWYHEKLYNFAQNIQKIIFKGLTTKDISQILKTDEYK